MAASVGVWVVRGGDNNELAPQVKQKSAVALGWGLVTDLSKVTTRDEVKNLVEASYPDVDISTTRSCL